MGHSRNQALPAVGRSRDLAITDFSFAVHVDSLLVDRHGGSYLTYARRRVVLVGAVDRDVPLTRGFVQCVLAMLAGGFLATAIWFGFLAPDRRASALATSAQAAMAPVSVDSSSEGASRRR
jgi:hypothetical protein